MRYHSAYDPEAVIQDADIEMLELRDAANEQEALCEEGDHTPTNENGSGNIDCIYCGANLV